MSRVQKSRLLAGPEALPRVGRATAEKLKAGGVTNLATLLASPGRASVAADDTAEVAEWQAAARLMTLEGMRAPLAGVLVAAGVAGIKDFAETSLRTLDHAVESSNLQKKPSAFDLAELQQRAWRRAGTGMVTIEVTNRAGKPMENALVRIGGRSARTNDEGWAAVDAVPAGKQRVEVFPPGALVPFGWTADVAEEAVAQLRFALPAKRKGAFATKARRQSQGATVTNRGASAIRLETIPLEELPDKSYLVVQPPLENGRVPLISLDKIRAGFELRIERCVVTANRIPPGTKTGDLVQLVNGSLVATDLTPAQVTRAWLKARRREIRVIGAPARLGTSDNRGCSCGGG